MTTQPNRKPRPRPPLKELLAEHAPSVAAALGGPLAGAAVSMLSRALLDREGASEDEIAEAIAHRDPAALIELRKVQLDFERAALGAAEAADRIAAGDRADARARQTALRDRIPGFLAVLILTGFFCILAVMLLRDVPSGAETEFSIMLGALSTMAAAVMNYYFGSSASSREKNHLLSGLPARNARG